MKGRQVVEEHDTFDELFVEPQFEEESNPEYYDQYSVNPAPAFPRPIVIAADSLIFKQCILMKAFVSFYY